MKNILHFDFGLSLLSAAASVFFEKELESQAVMEGKPVLLSCEVSSASVPVTWKKDNVALEEGGSCILRKNGAVHSLEIQRLCAEDAGEYSCISRGKKTTAKLIVRGGYMWWIFDSCFFLLTFSISTLTFQGQ